MQLDINRLEMNIQNTKKMLNSEINIGGEKFLHYMKRLRSLRRKLNDLKMKQELKRLGA